jgi:hypothetical protein
MTWMHVCQHFLEVRWGTLCWEFGRDIKEVCSVNMDAHINFHGDRTHKPTINGLKCEFGVLHDCWHFWYCYVLGHMTTPLDDIENIPNHTKKKNAYHLLFVLYQCYATWLVFEISSFCLQQCMHFIGHWFHQLVYDFHPNVVPLLL